MCIVGPMAATVADLTIAYRTISQPDPADPTMSLFAASIPPSPSSTKKYIGLCREWIDLAAPEVLAAFNTTVDYLSKNCGYEVVPIKLAYLKEGQWAHAATCLSEATDHARTRVADPKRWLSLMNHANRLVIGAGSATAASDYLKYGQVRQVIMQHLAHLFEQYPGLLVLSPTTQLAGWPVRPGEQDYGFTDGNITLRNMRYVWLANTSGCPAVSCPMGYAKPVQGDGDVPLGMMAMGEWGEEERLLGFAGELEAFLNGVGGGRARPAAWVDVLAKAQESDGEDTK
jgi:Asp-tRNA(Asn)/Glu-tRNA(Gln) amidotransferase A subunit family amidase